MPAIAGYELDKLDELLQMLDSVPEDNPARLLAEHLFAARYSLLGAMPREYLMNLDLARKGALHVDEARVRAKAKEILDDLFSVHRAR
jgi:hypothetical protein